MIAEAEIVGHQSRLFFVEQAAEMFGALPELDIEGEIRREKIQSYLAWMIYAYNLNLRNQMTAIKLDRAEGIADENRLISHEDLVYRLIIGQEMARGLFSEIATKDPNFDPKFWAQQILPFTPSYLDDYWLDIWELIYDVYPKMMPIIFFLSVSLPWT